MIVNPSYFRKQGRDALKGDLQTPLLVTFFSGLLLTAVSLLGSLLSTKMFSGMYDLMQSVITSASQGSSTELERFAINAVIRLNYNFVSVPTWMWIALGGSILGVILLMPSFKVSEHNYYLNRHRGVSLSVWQGLFGRFPSFFKCLGLYALMILKVFLWALILIPVMFLLIWLSESVLSVGLFGSLLLGASLIPAIRAYLHYCFAPLYLAEDPTRGIGECIKLSKKATAKRTIAVFGVMIFFAVLQVMASLLLELLGATNLPQAVLIVLELALTLLISVYSITTFTALFEVMAHPEKEASMHELLRRMMVQRGFDAETIEQMIKGRRGSEAGETKPDSPESNGNEPNPEDDSGETLN